MLVNGVITRKHSGITFTPDPPKGGQKNTQAPIAVPEAKLPDSLKSIRVGDSMRVTQSQVKVLGMLKLVYVAQAAPVAANAPPQLQTIHAAQGAQNFLNPYGFVSTPRNPVAAELNDHKPASFDRFHADRYSGSLDLTITTKTPLILVDASTRSGPQNGHPTFDVFRNGNTGVIPETALKGMLSSALETITSSRFRVWGSVDSQRRLGFRQKADTQTLVPMEVVAVGNLLKIQPYVGQATAGTLNNIQPAAWLPRYQGHVVNGPGGAAPKHKQRYRAQLALCEKYGDGQPVKYWRVAALKAIDDTSAFPVLKQIRPFSATIQGQQHGHYWRDDIPAIEVEGVAFISIRNIGGKHDERFFFNITPQTLLDLPEAVKTHYELLVKDYQREHEDEIGQIPPKLRPSALPNTCMWSRHIATVTGHTAALKVSELMLSDSDLVFGRIRGGQVSSLQPVMISRDLFRNSPQSLFEKQSELMPAKVEAEMSPADRMLGWVAEKAVEDQRSAWAGKLRILPIVGAENSIQDHNPAKTLKILGQPKPAQARFYTVNEAGQALHGASGSGLYLDTHRIAGRKHYLHHAQETWSANDQLGPPSPTQNRSVKAWIKPSQAFTTTIQFENLSKVELGALLYLANLCTSKPGFHFKLGGARPLGFGAVTLSAGALRLESGSERKSRYQELPQFQQAAGVVDATQCQRYIDQFKAVAPETSPAVLGFINAGLGSHSNLDVKAPPPNPNNGETFHWYVNNNKGQKHALEPLHNIRGLPNNPNPVTPR